jgi:heptosyltransferase-2
MLDLGLCDEAIEVDKSTKKRVGKDLLNRQFATVFCPHQSMTSHRIVGKLKAEQTLGFAQWWNARYFSRRVARRLDWPEAIRQMQLLALVHEPMQLKLEAFAKKPDKIPQWAEMNLQHFPWTEYDLAAICAKKTPGFQYDRPYICIAPGSVWATKRWPADFFVQAATSMVRNDYQVLVLGAPEERVLCESIQKQVPNSFSLAGHLSIQESLMVLQKAKGLICNDSGAMHMASVVGCPTVALFGPTVQELGYKPWSAQARVVEEPALLCRPCGQHGSHHCPIGSHACMGRNRPQRVVESLQSLLVR